MSNWTAQIDAWQAKTEKRLVKIHANASMKVKDSVVFGSPITASVGQPVDTGNLKNDWLAGAKFLEPLLWEISTNLNYAEAVEEGIQAPYTTKAGTSVTPRKMVFKSKTGGAHSVRQTRVGWERIVSAAVREEVK